MLSQITHPFITVASLSLAAMILATPLLADDSTITQDQQTIIYPLDQAYEADEVIDALENALVSQGLLSRGVMHLEYMLHRTGEDMGHESLYKMAESIEFCSAKQTYLMAKADRRNLTVCPFTILAYVSEDEPDKTYLMYQLPQLWGEGEALEEANREIKEMYNEIAQEALFFLQ